MYICIYTPNQFRSSVLHNYKKLIIITFNVTNSRQLKILKHEFAILQNRCINDLYTTYGKSAVTSILLTVFDQCASSLIFF